MKPKQILSALAFLLFISVPGFSTENPSKDGAKTETSAARAIELETRLNEIKSMDLKPMSRTEKRTLRKEVRGIEKEMKTMDNNGVYISVGAIIIIILLLILLL